MMPIDEQENHIRLAPRDRLAYSQVLTREMEAFLRPGEELVVDGESDTAYAWVAVKLKEPSKTHELTLECALISKEQDEAFERLEEQTRVLSLLGFLRDQFRSYFYEDRRKHFHSDWRHINHEYLLLRFRGMERSPRLEAEANRLLGED